MAIQRPGARRAPIQKKSGKPPMLLLVAILVPLLGILVVLIIQRGNKNEAASAPEKVEKTYDPNEELKALQKRFVELRDASHKVMRQDRESARFKKNIEILKRKWSAWMADFDAILGPVKNPDGSLPPEYQGYSVLRGQAQEVKLDVIKVGNF